MRPIEISPSVLPADFARLGDEIAALEAAGCDRIHWDVMDGVFVPNLTIGPDIVKSCRSFADIVFEAHLMVVLADEMAPLYVDAGCEVVMVHAEACTHLHRSLDNIQKLGAKSGVVLNPHTPADTIQHVLDVTDHVLIMTVNPGFGGQTYIPLVAKIEAVKQMVDAERSRHRHRGRRRHQRRDNQRVRRRRCERLRQRLGALPLRRPGGRRRRTQGQRRDRTLVSFYDEHHRTLQDHFDSRALADTLQAITVQPELDTDTAEFLTGREFFFLTTVRADGFPTVSHKGGPPGFVKVLDPTTVAFPNYDGNGMFLSMGNIAATAKVGLLFIDFEIPHRVRLHGEATVSADDELLGEFPGAELIVRVAITEQFVNCPLHRETRSCRSVALRPDDNGDAPTATWKKIDGMSAVLPPADAERRCRGRTDQHRRVRDTPPKRHRLTLLV